MGNARFPGLLGDGAQVVRSRVNAPIASAPSGSVALPEAGLSARHPRISGRAATHAVERPSRAVTSRQLSGTHRGNTLHPDRNVEASGYSARSRVMKVLPAYGPPERYRARQMPWPATLNVSNGHSRALPHGFVTVAMRRCSQSHAVSSSGPSSSLPQSPASSETNETGRSKLSDSPSLFAPRPPPVDVPQAFTARAVPRQVLHAQGHARAQGRLDGSQVEHERALHVAKPLAVERPGREDEQHQREHGP